MKRRSILVLAFVILSNLLSAVNPPAKTIRVLVITGGHDYKKEQFNQMFESLAPGVSYKIAELPGAYDMFQPRNRSQYDVLVFYHMWQKITDEQASVLADCIKKGKPLVALHHSICAYDDWPEYWNIIGGKYFHRETTFNGKVYQPCSYIHDLHFNVKVADSGNPVTAGVKDFPIFDETYKGYYVAEGVNPLLMTDEPSSTPLIGWTKKYGKAKVVVLQSGHDVPTFENENFRKLLAQAIQWVSKK
jgi:type 1 glutamine amidotransferase